MYSTTELLSTLIEQPDQFMLICSQHQRFNCKIICNSETCMSYTSVSSLCHYLPNQHVLQVFLNLLIINVNACAFQHTALYLLLHLIRTTYSSIKLLPSNSYKQTYNIKNFLLTLVSFFYPFLHSIMTEIHFHHAKYLSHFTLLLRLQGYMGKHLNKALAFCVCPPVIMTNYMLLCSSASK